MEEPEDNGPPTDRSEDEAVAAAVAHPGAADQTILRPTAALSNAGSRSMAGARRKRKARRAEPPQGLKTVVQ